VAGIVVIGRADSSRVSVVPLVTGLAILAMVAVARRLRACVGAVDLQVRVDPVIVGLVVGLLVLAYPAGRSDLEQASESFRLFRQQPTPELAVRRGQACRRRFRRMTRCSSCSTRGLAT
jgi:hypothetical protein